MDDRCSTAGLMGNPDPRAGQHDDSILASTSFSCSPPRREVGPPYLCDTLVVGASMTPGLDGQDSGDRGVVEVHLG